MEEQKQEKNEGREMATHIDYKDITRLANYVNPHARMMSRRRTGLSARQQRSFAQAVKRARYMALMPYINY